VVCWVVGCFAALNLYCPTTKNNSANPRISVNNNSFITGSGYGIPYGAEDIT
jgi:hypothetical protein